MRKYIIMIVFVGLWSCTEDSADVINEDCAGVVDGSAVVDSCGVCDDDPTNDCSQDCAGIWGGNSVVDNCGVCDSDSTNDCLDCTELATIFVEKMNAVDAYRSNESYNSEDPDLRETCDGMCAEVVTAAQALLDNGCEWPETDDGDAPTGPVTQEDVDGLESGYCGDWGVCG